MTKQVLHRILAHLCSARENNQIWLVSEETELTSFFYNAMTVYYHREHFVEILRKWPDANRLLKSVDTDLTCELYLAGVRALGIIDKIITALLWRLLESNVNIAEMGNPLQETAALFPGVATRCVVNDNRGGCFRDKQFEALFEGHTDSFDEIPKQILQILCTLGNCFHEISQEFVTRYQAYMSRHSTRPIEFDPMLFPATPAPLHFIVLRRTGFEMGFFPPKHES